MPLTILTPSYNRSESLVRLFNSLVNQTVQDFQWLIIDDGSTDNTKEVVENFEGFKFLLDYIKKENGGKHTAINYSHAYIKGKMVCIVDSDDWLLSGAVETMIKRSREYLTFANVKLLSFLRGKNENTPICNSFPKNPIISNHIDFRVNAHRIGDCCEVIDTNVLKEFIFPEHSGEKFLGEGCLWNYAGFKYNTAYIPEIIYICEYMDGGLTKSGRKLRLSCPLGGMDNSNSYFRTCNGRKVNNKILLKESLLFVCYGKFAGLDYKSIVKKAEDKNFIKLSYILGYFLYIYWRLKYA